MMVGWPYLLVQSYWIKCGYTPRPIRWGEAPNKTVEAPVQEGPPEIGKLVYISAAN